MISEHAASYRVEGSWFVDNSVESADTSQMRGSLTVRLWPVTGAPPTSYAYMNDTGVQPRRSPATDKQVNNLRV